MANSKSRKENKRNSEFSGYSNNQTTELSVPEERIQSATLVRQMQKPKKQLLLVYNLQQFQFQQCTFS